MKSIDIKILFLGVLSIILSGGGPIEAQNVRVDESKQMMHLRDVPMA